MNKFREIIDAWAVSFNPTDEQKQHADRRYSICNKCEHRKKTLGVERCGLCGCPISKKIFSQKAVDACPDGRWEDIDNDYHDNKKINRLL